MKRGHAYGVVFVIRNVGVQLVRLAQDNSGLVSPRTGYVAHSITASADDQSRLVKALDEPDTVCMPAHAEVEASETVTGQAVATALENNDVGPEELHHSRDDGLEDRLVRHVGNTVAHREVDSIMLSLANTDIAQLTSTREVLSILVEGHGHDSVRSIEGFFDTITMMDINVDVEYALVESKKLENTENDVCQNVNLSCREEEKLGVKETNHLRSRSHLLRSS